MPVLSARTEVFTDSVILLEPSGIDHSEPGRNDQFQLIKNSQCTYMANGSSIAIQRDR